jgi:uncharacterized repeat protein (TIGR04076 family)
MRMVIRVKEIIGRCPVYTVGDAFVLDQGYILDPAQSCRVCMHSLASVMPYYVALSHGIRSVELGLAREEDGVARVQCPDPCGHTGGGTVILELSREELERGS